MARQQQNATKLNKILSDAIFEFSFEFIVYIRTKSLLSKYHCVWEKRTPNVFTTSITVAHYKLTWTKLWTKRNCDNDTQIWFQCIAHTHTHIGNAKRNWTACCGSLPSVGSIETVLHQSGWNGGDDDSEMNLKTLREHDDIERLSAFRVCTAPKWSDCNNCQ